MYNLESSMTVIIAWYLKAKYFHLKTNLMLEFHNYKTAF